MKYILVLFFISLSLAAQTGYKTASIDNEGKAFWDIAKPDIKTSGYKYYIRYESQNQIVNLYSNDSLNFKGQVISYLKEVKDEKALKYVYDIFDIPEEGCNVISHKILSEKFYKLPTDDSIKGYKKGYFDCWWIDYTFKIGDNVLKKHYTCPWPQTDSIPEIKILKENYKLFEHTLQLKKIDDAFQSRLEGGKSYTDGFVHIYKFNSKENLEWNKYKPRSDYLKSKKDTIDALLKDYLSKNYDREITDCFDDFYLSFSNEGTLQEIRSNLTFRERFFNKEYHQCRKRIKKLFRKFNLKDLNLKYGFSRDFHFNIDGMPIIHDNTMYHSD